MSRAKKPNGKPRVSAIIVAAGLSRRMGFDKLFAPLAGKPVLAHAIGAFDRCLAIGEIIVVTREEAIEKTRKLVESEKAEKVAEIVAGGSERHLSVWNGIRATNPKAELIAIHDGARPLTTPAMIGECVELARATGAACCANPIPDTVKRATAKGIVTGSVDRNGLWAMQTPQVFRAALIVEAYAALIDDHETVTDEVSAVQRTGKQISLLRSVDWNFKITVPEDIPLAEQVLALRENGRPIKLRRDS